MEYQIAKGVFDIIPQETSPEDAWKQSSYWQYVEQLARECANLFGFREIRTPLFEKTELFQRSVGTDTDIVSKEMYTFLDKGNRSLTLRPEGTAAVMRCFIEKKLDQQSQIHKFFYIEPMFRYERQQAGRYRQHHQFGVEVIGVNSPYQDVEVMSLLFTFLSRLGLKGLTLNLNSIGSKESRHQYKEALKAYLQPFLLELSEDSQTRFSTNPLRILDSKDARDRKILVEAPSILDFLDPSSQTHFETVCSLLKETHIPFVINPSLVRGLDYYNNTVFEITAQELGAQNSLGGGGRYDGLIKQLGGPDLPAFGFGTGLERVIQTMIAQNVELPKHPHPLLLLIPMGEIAMKKSFELLSLLRKDSLAVEMDFTGKKVKNALRYANHIHAQYIAVIGDQEIESGCLQLKEMATGETTFVAFNEISKRLKNG